MKTYAIKFKDHKMPVVVTAENFLAVVEIAKTYEFEIVDIDFIANV